MNEIVTLVEIDWRQVIIAIVLSLGVVVSVWKAGEFICSKLGIETRKQRDHKLLNQTIEGLARLQDKHTSDMDEFKRTQEENVQQSIRHDEMIRDLPAGDMLVLDLYSESRPQWGDPASSWYREQGFHGYL